MAPTGSEERRFAPFLDGLAAAREAAAASQRIHVSLIVLRVGGDGGARHLLEVATGLASEGEGTGTRPGG